MADSIDLLDRQHRLLQTQDAADFFRELRVFHTFLTAGPADVAAVLGELRDEAAGIEERFAAHNANLEPELVALKTEMVERAPEVDDSGTGRQGARIPSLEWQFGFANFDQLATDGPDRLVVRQDIDTSPAGMMLRILESKLRELQRHTRSEAGQVTVSEMNLRPDLDDLSRRLRNLTDRHRHAAQSFSQAVSSNGGVQMMYLDMAVSQMNPEPRDVQTDEDEHAWIDDTFKRGAGGWHYVEVALAGRPLDERGREALEIHMEKPKPAVDRVYEDVRLKLAIAQTPEPAARPVTPAEVVTPLTEPSRELPQPNATSVTDDVPSVFISYAHEDKDLARAFADGLEAAELRVWIDDNELLAGDSIIEQIAQAVAGIDFFCALVSAASRTSKWCQKELSLAMTQGLVRDGAKIIPLRVDDVDMPDSVIDKLYVPLDPDDVPATVNRIVGDCPQAQSPTPGAGRHGRDSPSG